MARKKSAAETIADILAKYNVEVEEPIEVPESNYNHTNALAMFAKVPEHFVLGVCRGCNQDFAHNQPIPAGTRVGYCSDGCRKRSFEKDTGIKWDSVVSPRREPWDGDPPMIVTPDQLANLRNIAEWFSRNQTTLEIVDPEPSEEQEYQEDYQVPTTPLDDPFSELDLLSDSADSEPTNQYQAETHTNPESERVPEDRPQNSLEVDLFGFL